MPSYKHIYCDKCGGVIGMFNKLAFTCDKCGKEFALNKIDYNHLEINKMTGWIFPVINKEK